MIGGDITSDDGMGGRSAFSEVTSLTPLSLSLSLIFICKYNEQMSNDSNLSCRVITLYIYVYRVRTIPDTSEMKISD